MESRSLVPGKCVLTVYLLIDFYYYWTEKLPGKNKNLFFQFSFPKTCCPNEVKWISLLVLQCWSMFIFNFLIVVTAILLSVKRIWNYSNLNFLINVYFQVSSKQIGCTPQRAFPSCYGQFLLSLWISGISSNFPAKKCTVNDFCAY